MKSVQHLCLEMIHDSWLIDKKLECRKDSVLEAARLLVRAHNTQLVNVCSKIVVLPASGNVHGIQAGSRERSLYSLHAISLEPFEVHMWQIPAIHTWNRATSSCVITPGKIMVRRGQKSEPLSQLLKTLGVAKREAKPSDLCNHFQCWRTLDTGCEWLNRFPKHLHGSVYQRWWSFNGFKFLQLPPELRELILTFALNPLAVPFAGVLHSDRGPRSSLPDMRLSLVSKQLNREVIAALLAHTKFYFPTIAHILFFFDNTQDVSRAFYRPVNGFKLLELDLNAFELLWLFSVSLGSEDTDIWRFDSGIFSNNETPLCHKIRIHIPHIPSCQKAYNLAFWAGARARLRNIAVVELVGQIDTTLKEEWLAEHALDRKMGIEAEDFGVWQKDIWTQW